MSNDHQYQGCKKQRASICGLKNCNLADTDLGNTKFPEKRKSHEIIKANVTRLYCDTRKEIFVLKGWLS